MNKEGLEYFKECVVLFSNFATQQIAERAVKAAAKGEPKELIRQLEEGKVHNQEMANKLLAKILESGKAPKRPTAGNPEKSEAPRLVMIYVTGRRVMGIDTSEAAGEIVGMQIKGLRGSTEVYARLREAKKSRSKCVLVKAFLMMIFRTCRAIPDKKLRKVFQLLMLRGLLGFYDGVSPNDAFDDARDRIIRAK
jgi:hypothetical protein